MSEAPTLRQSINALTAALIVARVQQHDGNRSAAARSLGITREGLYRAVSRLGIELPPGGVGGRPRGGGDRDDEAAA